MSNSPTGPTSTTASSTSSPSPSEVAALPERVAVVGCGAIAQQLAAAAASLRLPIDVHPLPPKLHNRPQRIPAEVERLVGELRGRYRQVVVGYADCGTYGGLDAVCERLGVQRLPGITCYDLFAGQRTFDRIMAESPGSFLLIDFLVRAFDRLVVRELGLDRFPELRDDYFGHYERMVWLVQTTDAAEFAELQGQAQRAAARIGLPLHVVRTGLGGLEQALVDLVSGPLPAR